MIWFLLSVSSAIPLVIGVKVLLEGGVDKGVAKAKVTYLRSVGRDPSEADLLTIRRSRIIIIACLIACPALFMAGIKGKRYFTTAQPEAAAEYSLPTVYVPSDPGATYTVISKSKDKGLGIIMTKRSGSSGITYSQRAYDCAAGTVMYLGTGSTYAELKASKPDASMSPVVSGSIAFYVGQEACR